MTRTSRSARLPAFAVWPEKTNFGPLPQLEWDHRLSAFKDSLDGWLAKMPVPPIEALNTQAGLSARQVERNCKTLYGASPKILAREVRALRAAAALESNPEQAFDTEEHGFYDQSHLIREVKHFTGLTPGQHRALARLPLGDTCLPDFRDLPPRLLAQRTMRL